jgi:hypothetical protein
MTAAPAPGGRRRRAEAPSDPFARPVLNPGGPVTEADRLDARHVLSCLTGGGPAGLSGAVSESGALADHYAPSYDPDRIVRILTALVELLPAEIDRWKNSRLSRVMARDLWIELLFGGHCALCAQRCHTCQLLADTLGYQRADGPHGTHTLLTLQNLTKSRLVYWLPRSAWKMTPFGGRRCFNAIARASITRSVRMWSATAQPTTFRENASMTDAT